MAYTDCLQAKLEGVNECKEKGCAGTAQGVPSSKYDKRDCIRVEITALEAEAGIYCCRTVIYLEKESKIPIRMENYDWPRQGGAAGGDLLEMFSYVGLRFNAGLRDEEFNK